MNFLLVILWFLIHSSLIPHPWWSIDQFVIHQPMISNQSLIHFPFSFIHSRFCSNILALDCDSRRLLASRSASPVPQAQLYCCGSYSYHKNCQTVHWTKEPQRVLVSWIFTLVLLHSSKTGVRSRNALAAESSQQIVCTSLIPVRPHAHRGL